MKVLVTNREDFNINQVINIPGGEEMLQIMQDSRVKFIKILVEDGAIEVPKNLILLET